MRYLHKHLTYANVVATLALSLAVGMGGAYAANQLAPKSVGERQLRPSAVTAEKIRKNAVTAPKINALAVKQGKIANGAITSAKIADGEVGAQKLPNFVITSEKIADGVVTGDKVNEATLGQVPSAANADNATFAGSSNPEAFAKVDGEGTVFPGNSKGISTANVKQGLEPGIYCIEVPGFNPKGAQATPEFSGHADVSVYVKFGGTASCTAPKVEVQTFNNGSRQKEPFYVMFYR